jgi:transcriptional regulator with XRE-family HTH domain
MNFKDIRRESGMNLTQFSKYFGIPYRTIQNWERGERQCPEYLLDLMKYKLDMEGKKEQVLQVYINMLDNFKESEESNIYEHSTRIAKDLNELKFDCEKRIEEFKDLLNK